MKRIVNALSQLNWSGAGLVQGANGSFYGITPYGGTLNEGTVFSLSI